MLVDGVDDRMRRLFLKAAKHIDTDKLKEVCTAYQDVAYLTGAPITSGDGSACSVSGRRHRALLGVREGGDSGRGATRRLRDGVGDARKGQRSARRSAFGSLEPAR